MVFGMAHQSSPPGLGLALLLAVALVRPAVPKPIASEATEAERGQQGQRELANEIFMTVDKNGDTKVTEKRCLY